jgi:hypothetical protein
LDALSPNQVLHPRFLEQARSTTDLVQRLQRMTNILAEEETLEEGRIDPDDLEAWPGLAATATTLATDKYWHHEAKPVRLYATLASLELLAVVST